MLEIKNISASYGSIQVLHDVNAVIENGSFTGIIGRNGAGKSTLLKILCGLHKASKGSILINGANVKDINKNDMAKILAFMPQTVDTSFPFSVREFILFGRYPYMNMLKIPTQNDWDEVEKTINFMGIAHIAGRKITGLSGGEKQKVLIAQTIAQNCSILVFDEPTAHLDIGGQYAILEFLKDLNEKFGKTIIATLHDLNAAGEFCSNLILMNEGRAMNAGSAEEVLNYQDIELAYQTKVVVKTNPISQKPYVIPIGNR
jgi:iron complex transport system ATP-binding protein